MSRPVARRNDPISNGDMCAHGSVTVKVNNKPIIRKIDLTEGTGGQSPTIFQTFSSTVKVENKSVVRIGDAVIPNSDPGIVIAGSPNVKVG
ncbi:MAG: hypothetical protein QXN55_01695 [Candidatus Nitrosotenuis sp.]